MTQRENTVHCLLHILSAHFVKTLFGIFAGTRANKVEPALETQQGFQQKHSGKAVKLLSYREDEEKKISIISTERGLQILY